MSKRHSIRMVLINAREFLSWGLEDSIMESLRRASPRRTDYVVAVAVCQSETPGVNLVTWEAAHPERAESLALLEWVIAREGAALATTTLWSPRRRRPPTS